MDHYVRPLFLSMLAAGFLPVLLLIVFCVLTGRARWLFSRQKNADLEPPKSMILNVLRKLALWMFPVYLILLVVFVVISFNAQ